jgi:hypothetical protein
VPEDDLPNAEEETLRDYSFLHTTVVDTWPSSKGYEAILTAKLLYFEKPEDIRGDGPPPFKTLKLWMAATDALKFAELIRTFAQQALDDKS